MSSPETICPMCRHHMAQHNGEDGHCTVKVTRQGTRSHPIMTPVCGCNYGAQMSEAPLVSTPPMAILTYRADTSTTTASDPGTGLLRWNATTVEAVTALYFDRLTADNNNDVMMLWQLANPGRLIIQQADMALNTQTWKVALAMVPMADWFQVPVSLIASKGTGVDLFKPIVQTRLLIFLMKE